MESITHGDSQLFTDQFMQFLTQASSSLLDLFSKLNFFILLPIFIAVSVFLIGYFRNYQWPANRIRKNLVSVVGQLRVVRGKLKNSPDALERALDNVFATSPFNALWAEYCASLHVLQGVNDRKSVLATVPAEAFFSKENVVDLHINADFYRHLPGILTGIGIIGTFSGLVWGLHQFKPDTTDALSSLPLLLQEVTSAFIGSGFAILAAIFVTFKEKSILNRCYGTLGELSREIDSLYATGAGEEYLARLVVATENSTAATERHSQMLAQQVAAAISAALAEPMAELSVIIQRVTANQEAAIGSILEEVLRTFAGRLEDTFGDQIERVNESFEKSSAAMLQVQRSMTALLGDMASVGTNAVDQMAGTLATAVEHASTSQDMMQDQMRTFTEELSAMLTQHQTKSSEVMDVTMRAVLAKLQAAITRLAVDRGEQVEQDQKRLEVLTNAVTRLVESVDASSLRTAESLGVLQSTASGAISGMNNGAVVMRMAADRFTMAGNTLSDALEKTGALSDTVEQLQGLLTSTVQLRRAS